MYVDPLAEKFPQLTPYNYAGNKPITYKDLNGLQSDGGDEELNSDNRKFFKNISSYVDSEITTYENKLENEEEKYKKRNWKIDRNSGNFKTYRDRIDTLKNIKSTFETIETNAKKSGGNNLLTLSNVVHNEAAQSNKESKEAVAYAYLNRIDYKEGGTIREPKKGEISHYLELSKRWESLKTDSAKLTFLKSFEGSFNAAQSRLDEEDPQDNDPTKGATHWISPMASIFDTKNGSNTHKRIINEKIRYVPEWVKSNKDTSIKSLMSGPKAILNSNYKEIQLNNDFYFYKGVKY